jgi:chromosome segregation protein
MRLVTQARTDEAGLVERTSALEADVERLQEAARELETRLEARRTDIARTETRREELRGAITANEQRLDEDVVALDAFRVQMRTHDEQVVELRGDFTAREQEIRGARQRLDAVRGEVMQSEVTRATAMSDLNHLASACFETIGSTLEEVVVRVSEMEAAGELEAPSRRLAAAATPDEDEDALDGDEPAPADAQAAESDAPLSPEQIIFSLKTKIERLGPVNMMAIDQFDELESRHEFLTTQRQDLLDSIAQTGEAIRKIDKTTRERFAVAFEAINLHFQTTFTTLFGGGRAGLVLIDQENDPESGIDMIAQPPGKRLQNVQLLSGGEKALTAMALMFAVFKYRPSPFCLLDEIDAPLDDANIGRFVEMLQGMQDHTQFILITHNRKTMEIADRLYGVTMEEPGVSKLISLQMN